MDTREQTDQEAATPSSRDLAERRRRERGPARRRREEIAESVESGATIDELERDVIERPPLSRESRDALWLFAWSQLERRQIRSWARAWGR